MIAKQRKYGRFGTSDVQILIEFAPTEVGQLAIQFAHHFGIISAKPDGEDSSGRSKLALLEPQEVASRSCDCAEKLWAEMKKRNMIIDVPLPKEEEPPSETEQAK
jgi:hypothetical protein